MVGIQHEYPKVISHGNSLVGSCWIAELDDESLGTLMTEAESVINNRPLLVEDFSHAEFPAPLTPNQFLTMESSIVLPIPGNFQLPDLYPTDVGTESSTWLINGLSGNENIP